MRKYKVELRCVKCHKDFHTVVKDLVLIYVATYSVTHCSKCVEGARAKDPSVNQVSVSTFNLS